jgi:hypothetical protein
VKRFITSPVPYVVWALAVSAALYGTSFADPYVFGFTTLGLAWLTGAVALVGVLVCLVSRTARASTRVIIVGSLVLAAAAIAKALATLRSFDWA